MTDPVNVRGQRTSKINPLTYQTVHGRSVGGY
jgi:hypothetical protein